MRASGKWLFISACVPVISGAVSAHAADVTQTKTVGVYRVELHVLPAEPFFSKADVTAKNIKEGMEIEGGATPIPPDADSHPNHHLVVHLFDKKTSKAVTDATVTMSFVALDSKAKPAGAPSEVPVVIMQAIGMGPKSTHYGNNVVMPAGTYRVTVMVNGKNAAFQVSASDTPAGSGGSMGGMQMR